MNSVRKMAAMDPITAALGSRKSLGDVQTEISAAVMALREHREACRAYQGGLLAENISRATRRKAALKAARLTARRAWLSRQGRPIDLLSLLRQKRKDGLPAWAVADPTSGIATRNGGVLAGMHLVEGTPRNYDIYLNGYACRLPTGIGSKVNLSPAAGDFPPLPEQARRLLRDTKIRSRARWIGVLYQPAEWTVLPERSPDPAVVVEWIDLPGQYFALAVWGGDRAQIMEFVD